MKFSKLREDRDNLSGKLSDIVRQLNFAGLAVIWIFRTGGTGSGGITYSNTLVWPMLFLVASLTSDLLHYAVASAAIDSIYRGFDDKKTKDDEDVRFSKKPARISRVFFWGKAAFSVLAYGWLIVFVATRL
jgi:hypothetical protein